jgi:hypothetical protein
MPMPATFAAYLNRGAIASAVLVVSISSAAADHSTLGECYDYVVAQCNAGDDADAKACLEFGFDDCDGSYDEPVIPQGRLKLKTNDGPGPQLKLRRN